MSGDDPTIELVQGCQRWTLARTDRDGASAAEVAAMVAGFLQWVFRDVGESDAPGASPEEVFSTSDLEWRVSAARPVRVIDGPRKDDPGPFGSLIATREQLAELPLLNASHPWYLTIELWWRAPTVRIRWPALSVTWYGRRYYSLEQADWLLVRSSLPASPIADPGDESWSDAVSASVSSTIAAVKNYGKSLAVIGTIAVGVAIGLALSRRVHRVR